MSEKPTYELKGTLREDCMRDTATLEDFRALESDWQVYILIEKCTTTPIEKCTT